MQLQLVTARHHDLGKLLTNGQSNSNSNNNNNNNNDNKLNNLQASQQQLNQQLSQQKVNAAQILNDVQPILKQKPILDQKITPQLPSDINAPSGAVLSKDDGEYTLSTLSSILELKWHNFHTKKEKKPSSFYLSVPLILYLETILIYIML